MARKKPDYLKTNVEWDIKKIIWQLWAQGNTIKKTLELFELNKDKDEYKNAPLDRNTIRKVRDELNNLPPSLVCKLVDEMPAIRDFVLELRPDLVGKLESPHDKGKQTENTDFLAQAARIHDMLQKENMIIEHDDDDGHPYSFSQILKATGDILTLGAYESSFGYQILECLNLDRDEGWYIPPENMTHLIAIFIQYGIIDRIDRPYQHWVSERPTISILDNQPAHAHMEQGIRIQYKLSHFGVSILRKLDEQEM